MHKSRSKVNDRDGTAFPCRPLHTFAEQWLYVKGVYKLNSDLKIINSRVIYLGHGTICADVGLTCLA